MKTDATFRKGIRDYPVLPKKENKQPLLAVFLATSGHSGVDRITKNLLPAIASRGIRVDLLHVRDHGPYIEPVANLRIVELGTKHAYSSFLPLINYLRREKPEALLSDKDRVNRVALLARVISGVPIRSVIRTGTTVSLDLATKKPLDCWFHRLSMRYLYPLAQAVVSPSEDAAADLALHVGKAKDKVVTIPNPVVTPDLAIRAQDPLTHIWLDQKECPVIMGIGELCDRKDFETLLQAFSMVRKSRRVRLMILGDGRRRAALEQLVRDLSLEKDVLLTGFFPNPYPYLRKADLYVHSAKYEGFGVSLVEALALGVPAVSTNCPSGPREILKDGAYGRLVPVGDARSMAAAIEDTLDHPPAPEKLGEAVRPYTLEESVKGYLETLGLEN